MQGFVRHQIDEYPIMFYHVKKRYMSVEAQLLRDFFRLLDEHSDMLPQHVAVEYANFVSESKLGNLSIAPFGTYNVSVLSKGVSLAYLTKRIVCIAEKTILSHSGYHNWVVRNYDERSRLYMKCDSLADFGKWLLDSRELLINGDVFYYPQLMFSTTPNYDEYLLEGDGAWNNDITGLYDIIIDKRLMTEIGTQDIRKSRLLYPIARIDLPYIDGVGMDVFSKIATDNKDAIDCFRKMLRYHLIDIQEEEGSESYFSKLSKLEYKIHQGVKELESRMKKLKYSRAFQASGAAVTTLTAVLVAINTGGFEALLKTAGIGGGMMMLLNSIEKYSLGKIDIANSPYYFLWLLSGEKH